MKIAFIIPSLKKTAPIELVKSLASGLLERGNYVKVFYFDDIIDVNFPCDVEQISFFKLIEFQYFDIVHSHLMRPDFYNSFIIKYKKKQQRPFLISTLHNDISSVLTSYYGTIFSFLFRKIWYAAIFRSDLVICLSNVQSNFLREQKVDLNTEVVYNGITITEQNEPAELDSFFQILRNEFKVLGMIVNLYKLKGIIQVIDALKFLPEYSLVLIGNGPELDRLKRHAEKINVIGRCHFLGHVNDAHIYNKYFDVFIMSSYSEGFGISILEAAHYSRAIVCSDLKLFQELFSNEEVVFFELDNIKSLSDAIVLAYKKRQILGQKINSLLNKRYTKDKMIEQYIKVYKKLLF